MLHKLYNRYSTDAEADADAEQGNYKFDESETDCCVVCLCQVSKGKKVRTLAGCNHSFHADCIGAWLKDHNTCPLCRNKISNHHNPYNYKLQDQVLRHSMILTFMIFSDILFFILYMTLPASVREDFPLDH
ncbi:hypothetical protein RIF29_23963 [Crotalaria pallida]|uniref:RING-type E3 ubiquitin transferase n=1 Tax=Crotalaria pallida TaxID=3830 RepID=A0AAN9EIY6_CROPI